MDLAKALEWLSERSHRAITALKRGERTQLSTVAYALFEHQLR